ncbi:hypothetical protein J4465_01985 [Candidatus Pacearchaeota archaeon]|nr:hypothetical protein [Candidatus Pacearchaeota archaeon]
MEEKMPENKYLIFDSSSIITFAMNDLTYSLKELHEKFNGDFIFSKDVEKETITRSLDIPRFMLEALQIKGLVNDTVFTRFEKNLKKETERVLDIANHTFKAKGEWISIIHGGEASCLAIYKMLTSNKKAIVIDERTTRMLCESPENLRKLLGLKLHTKVDSVKENYDFFKDIKIIRSCELMFFAYSKGLIPLPANKRDSIKALLYAAKYKGCSVSNQEIKEAINYI